jgi:hypothetical protein
MFRVSYKVEYQQSMIFIDFPPNQDGKIQNHKFWLLNINRLRYFQVLYLCA